MSNSANIMSGFLVHNLTKPVDNLPHLLCTKLLVCVVSMSIFIVLAKVSLGLISVCTLYEVQKCPLLRGSKGNSSMVKQIGGK